MFKLTLVDQSCHYRQWFYHLAKKAFRYVHHPSSWPGQKNRTAAQWCSLIDAARLRADVQALGSVLDVRSEQQGHPYRCYGVIPTEQVVGSLLLGRHA